MLMLLAGLNVAVFRGWAGQTVRGHAQALFAPVAAPVNAGLSWAGDLARGTPDAASPDAPRSIEDVRTENEQLRIELASLRGQLERLKEINADRELLGNLRQLCKPARVIGGGAGDREVLQLLAGTHAGIGRGNPVLYGGGLAGIVTDAGLASSQVRLVSDRDMRMTITFGRYARDDAGQTTFDVFEGVERTLVGVGDNRMLVKNVVERDAQATDLRPGDWAVLRDAEWPDVLQGYKIGRVASIEPQSTNPGFVTVVVEPARDLRGLRDVMVLTATR
ncbi:MAG: rod shape-determining protein MreC [Phycisphaerae bacterium]